jgi:hypothetical protein
MGCFTGVCITVSITGIREHYLIDHIFDDQVVFKLKTTPVETKG